MKLGEILKIYRVETRVKDEIEYKQVTISQHTGVKYRGKKLGISIGRKRQFIVDLVKYPNTVMFTRQGLKDGAIGFASKEVHNCIVTENMPTLSVNTDKVDVRYLERLLNSNYFLKKISELTIVGSAQKSIHERDLLKLEINIPDLETQKIIAEKIISKEGNYYSLTNEIQTQKQLLTNLKQAILQEAIQGKLTQDWRTRHPLNSPLEGGFGGVEPASELLKRIKAEKAQLIKEGKIKKEKPLPPITQEEIPFELPNGWVWCRLGNLCSKITDGFHNTPPKVNSGFPYIAATHVKSDKIDWNSAHKVSEKYHRELHNKTRPMKGEILVVNIGAGSGCPAIIDVDFEFSFKNTAILKFNQTLICNKYLFYYLISIQDDNYKMLTRGANQPFLSLKVIKNFSIPFPPIEEQKEIVKKVEVLMQKCTALEQEINQSETNAQMLMQAVLKEAFEG